MKTAQKPELAAVLGATQVGGAVSMVGGAAAGAVGPGHTCAGDPGTKTQRELYIGSLPTGAALACPLLLRQANSRTTQLCAMGARGRDGSAGLRRPVVLPFCPHPKALPACTARCSCSAGAGRGGAGGAHEDRGRAAALGQRAASSCLLLPQAWWTCS